MLANIVGPDGLLIFFIVLVLPIVLLVDARQHGASWNRILICAVACLIFGPIGLIASIVVCVMARRSSRQNLL